VWEKHSCAAENTHIAQTPVNSDKKTDKSFQNRKLQDSTVTGSVENKECVNVNSASHKQLISLHGIGPVLAERIVDYRKKNGKFKNASELIKVKGIGKGKLQKIKNIICF
jgi:competence protein ComEA